MINAEPGGRLKQKLITEVVKKTLEDFGCRGSRVMIQDRSEWRRLI